MARPGDRQPDPHRDLRHRPGGMPGAGVVRLHQSAVLAAGQELRGVLHRRGRHHAGQRRQRLRASRSARCPSVELAGDAAKVTFTVDRNVKVGDQTLVAIKTDTVLGQKSLAVTPGGTGNSTVDPVGPHHHSVHAEHRTAGSRRERQRAGQAEVRAGAADADRHAARRHAAVARRARRRRRPVAQPQQARRGARAAARRTPRGCPTPWPSGPAR